MREVMDGAMVAAAAAVAAEQHQLVKEAMACTTKVSHDGQDLSFAEVIALDGETEQDKWISLSLHQKAERAKFFLRRAGVVTIAGADGSLVRPIELLSASKPQAEWWKGKQAQEGNMRATNAWCRRCAKNSHDKQIYEATNCRSEARAQKAQV